MANTIQVNQSSPFAGLGTATFTVVTAGLYTVQVKSFIPYTPPGTSYTSTTAATAPSASALQFVVNQDTGGGPVAKLTISSPSPTQPIMSGAVVLSCAAGDVITVVFTSSAAADNALNAVKSIINLFQGE